ncbi:MAG TPA: CUAEP/CCAEP-tail radical SAM protein [Candidatus Acidoferrales bacterium]|nr:CUAEP/CCAEP-tail radical SAM protein [Candidatus Acidoferrales bacterium]
MHVVLISTYELGRQPFGLASPAAWLRQHGARVTCLDLSREAFQEAPIRAADLVALYVPMHTATRLATELIRPIQQLNPRAHLCFYGLYAPVNEAYLRSLGVGTILGGEYEEGLAHLVERLDTKDASAAADSLVKAGLRACPSGEQAEPVISLARQQFVVPDRAGMVPLEQYAHLILPGGEHRTVGYTEASRGCKHLCRHCPIVPVYQGAFRVVQRAVVLEDIRRQVELGARHVTFGDPDFFNGVGHALAIVEALHREHPRLTYDVTIKIEHLLKHAQHLRTLRDTGCLWVTSAVESVDDAVLVRLEKGHTRADFLATVERFRNVGLVLQPTFVPFTPWTTLKGYGELLGLLDEHDLVESVAPIQLGIRLLIPAGSRLLELAEVRELVGPFDEVALVYPWRHADPRVDALCEGVQELVRAGEKLNRSRMGIFARIGEAARRAAGLREPAPPREPVLPSRATIPYLNEPWYC